MATTTTTTTATTTTNTNDVASPDVGKPREPPTLLVVCGSHENWYEIFAEEEAKGTLIVEQTMWDEISLTSYSDSGPVINLQQSAVPVDISRQSKQRLIKPSLVLVRSLCRYIGRRIGSVPDYRPILYGLVHAGIPMVNSFPAVSAEIERPVMYGALRGIERRVGHASFPLIPQYYYPEFCEMGIAPPTPFVAKISFPHAGYGKMRIKDQHDWEDLRSVVAVNNTYSSAEPFIESAYELRIVFIAPDYYRVHKRASMSWKVNMGSSNVREDTEMTPRYKFWCDQVSVLFGGMDTFCIDAIVARDGREYILEVNGSSQGFAPEHHLQDLAHMRSMVLTRLDQAVEAARYLKPTPRADYYPVDPQVEEAARVAAEERDKKAQEGRDPLLITPFYLPTLANPEATPPTSEEEKATRIVNLKNRVEELEHSFVKVAHEKKQYETAYRALRADASTSRVTIVGLLTALLALVAALAWWYVLTHNPTSATTEATTTTISKTIIPQATEL